MGIVTAADVREKLEQWLTGRLSAQAVHAWGESRFASEDWDPESKSVHHVLSELDRMDMNLVTVEEVQIFLEALQATNALRVIGDHYAGLDIEARKRACKVICWPAWKEVGPQVYKRPLESERSLEPVPASLQLQCLMRRDFRTLKKRGFPG